MLNRFVAQGRMTGAPKQMFSDNGVPFISFTFRIGDNRRIKNAEGSWQPYCPIKLFAYNKVAEIILKYISNNQMLIVEGVFTCFWRRAANGKKICVERKKVERVYFGKLTESEIKSKEKIAANDTFLFPEDVYEGFDEAGWLPMEATENESTSD